MSISFRLLSTLAVLGSVFWACAPDLDALSSKYNPNAAGMGGSSTSGSAGKPPGTGGASATGGTGLTGGTSGDGSGGTFEGGAAGQAGEAATGGTTSGTGGTTSGTGGSGPPPASCENGTADSNESDIDCGGSSKCPRCDLKKRCGSNSDCLSSLFCYKGHCTQPSCSDAVQNGSETGVDCGGSCVDEGFACDDGIACGVNKDCTSEFCSSEVCTDHCTSNRRESDETDVDCGGKQCSPCGENKKCVLADDCASKICTNKLCAPATCSDNVLNQTESDTDCGGSCTPAKYCAIDAHCNTAADCVSYVCNSSHKCAADITVPAVDVLDDFEDSNYNLPPNGGRVGNWYPFGDGTGMESWLTAPITGQRGPSSLTGLHVFGGMFTSWGCGTGVDMNNSGGGQFTKVPYNASFDDGGTPTPYAGITFWARSDAGTLSLSVVFPDGDTDAAGGICNQTGTACGATACVCDHHYLTAVSVGADWKRYIVLFKDLQLEPGDNPVPTAFDPTRLVSVQFRINGGTTFDFWVDDVAFVRP